MTQFTQLTRNQTPRVRSVLGCSCWLLQRRAALAAPPARSRYTSHGHTVPRAPPTRVLAPPPPLSPCCAPEHSSGPPPPHCPARGRRSPAGSSTASSMALPLLRTTVFKTAHETSVVQIYMPGWHRCDGMEEHKLLDRRRDDTRGTGKVRVHCVPQELERRALGERVQRERPQLPHVLIFGKFLHA